MDLHTFLALLADPAQGDDDIWDASQELVCEYNNQTRKQPLRRSARAAGSTQDAEAICDSTMMGLRALANRMSYETSRQRRAMIATVAAVLVEHGGDVWEIAEQILNPLPEWLRLANRLLEACLEDLDEHLEDCDEGLEDIWLQDGLVEDCLEEDDLSDDFAEDSAFDLVLNEFRSKMPEEADCWEALNLISQPAVTLLSRETSLRKAGHRHRCLSQQLADYHEGAYWLNAVYEVLDNEPILILAPDCKQGFVGSISGVADNMQLQTLMIDTASRLRMGDVCELSRRVVDVALGLGPQAVDEVVEVQWNMYSWEALGPDHRLPHPEDYNASDYWIWGEGTPADIPVFDGFRVILLGPPSYKRSWPAQRRFGGMRAELAVDSALSASDVEGWLNRMSAEKLNGH